MISSDPDGSLIYPNINAAESAVICPGGNALDSLQSQRLSPPKCGRRVNGLRAKTF